MSDFIGETTDLLRRTPDLLRVLLGGIGEAWTDTTDVPADGWRPKDVVGHLITGELTDWVERTRRILEHGTSMPFDRFDRLAHEATGRKSGSHTSSTCSKVWMTAWSVGRSDGT